MYLHCAIFLIELNCSSKSLVKCYALNVEIVFVAFRVTNPCRITRKEFLMKQTKIYVCTREEFILVDIWIHCCASWNCTVLYCTRS